MQKHGHHVYSYSVLRIFASTLESRGSKNRSFSFHLLDPGPCVLHRRALWQRKDRNFAVAKGVENVRPAVGFLVLIHTI